MEVAQDPPAPADPRSRFPPGSGCGCCRAATSSTGTAWTPGSSCSRPARSASATSWVRARLCRGEGRGGSGAAPASPRHGRVLLPCREALHGELAGPTDGQTDALWGQTTLRGQTHRCRDGFGTAVPVAALGLSGERRLWALSLLGAGVGAGNGSCGSTQGCPGAGGWKRGEPWPGCALPAHSHVF